MPIARDDDYDRDPYDDDSPIDDDYVDDDEEATEIECPHCGREIYDDTEQCPYCGQYLSDTSLVSRSMPWWVWLGLVGAAVAVLSWYVF